MVVNETIRGVAPHINWWAIILPFAFVIIFFLCIFIFAQKRYRNRILRWHYGNQALEVNIIKDNHYVISGIVNMSEGEFKHNSMTYLIKEKAIYYEKWKIRQKPMAWYIENNPEPLMFDFSTRSAKFTGIDLTKWTQSKLIQMLLDTNIEKLIQLVLIFVIIFGIISLVGIFLTIKNGTQTMNMLSSLNQTISLIRR
jgi:hypothetical protein